VPRVDRAANHRQPCPDLLHLFDHGRLHAHKIFTLVDDGDQFLCPVRSYDAGREDVEPRPEGDRIRLDPRVPEPPGRAQREARDQLFGRHDSSL